MKTLVLDGVEYVKASEAAKAHGYTSDYVGQLCRGGKIQAKLVGRSWYVDIESLLHHRQGRYRSSQKKTSEIAKEEIASKIENNDQSIARPNYYGRLVEEVDIRYESDEKTLIPEPVKLVISSSEDVVKEKTEQHEHSLSVVEAPEESSDYYLETENQSKPQKGVLVVQSEEEDDRLIAEAVVQVSSNRIASSKKISQRPVLSNAGRKRIHNTTSKPKLAVREETQFDAIAAKNEPSTSALSGTRSPYIALAAPVSLSLLAGLAVASLLVGYSWSFQTSELGDTASYRISLSSVIQSFSP